MFLHCFSPKDFPKERVEESLVLINNLVYLVQNMKQHLKIDQVQVLCRLVECLTTVIVLQTKGIDIQDKSEELATEINPDKEISTTFDAKDIPEEMSSLLKKQCGFVDAFVSSKIHGSIQSCSNSEWDKELFVSYCRDLHQFVTIDKPKLVRWEENN
jgi:hypothetical protein